MRRSAWYFLAIVSICLAAATLWSAARPRYGGTLRVEMRVAVASLDPTEGPDANRAAKEKLATLVFDRLVQLSDDEQPQPQLALSWQHDVEMKGWQFRLRPGVKFHDGSPLTAAAVVAALQRALP